MGNCYMLCYCQNKYDIVINNPQIINQNSFDLEDKLEVTNKNTDGTKETYKQSSNQCNLFDGKHLTINKKQQEKNHLRENFYQTKHINSNDLVFNNSFSNESDYIFTGSNFNKKTFTNTENAESFFLNINLSGFNDNERSFIFDKIIKINKIKKIQKNFIIFLRKKINSLDLFNKEHSMNLKLAFRILKTIKYDDGSVYKGQTESNERKGIGIILDENYVCLP